MNALPARAQVGLSRCDVLVVEDDVAQCGEMAGYLGRSGLATQMAYDGVSALYQAAEHRPRVVLLDFHLPDMTGVQLARQLRPLLPGSGFIMMSGHIGSLSEQTLQEIGIAVFVNKPVPLGPLRRAVLKLAQSPQIGLVGRRRRKKGWFATGLMDRRS